MHARSQQYRKWLTYATCVWAISFSAPHAWWALGIPVGFPGGEANHRLWMSSTWRYLYNVAVVLLSLATVLISLALLWSNRMGVVRTLLRTAAWIGGGMLLLRGVGGMIVDGPSDLIWWPTFLTGGLLLSSVAWLGRMPSRVAPFNVK
jgi:hypothetical protein